jgi:hypothetical protein
MMATRLVNVIFDANDHAKLARFWSDLTGWPIAEESPEEIDVRAPDEYGLLDLVFGPVPEVKTGQNRVHLDLNSTSPEHQEELVAKALELGARRIDVGQGDVPWVVLADPEGNEFCVLEPRPAFAGTGALAVIVLASPDPIALAPFWSAATGWPVVGQRGDGVATLRSPDNGVVLGLVRTDEPKRGKNRVHLDVAPFADDDQAAEVDRLIALGARHADIGQSGEEPWVVLADPAGNEVCVLTSR